MSRVVVTLKAGARLSLVAKVRGLALELKARASGPRTGAASRVPVPAEAQGRGVLPGDHAELPDGNRPRARALALYEDVGGTAEDERVQEVSGLDAV